MISRTNSDRRTATLRTAIHSIYRNRRTSVRRETDMATDVYFDRHEPWFAYLALGVMLLSITDAYFTLYILNHGGEEISPVVEYLVQQGNLSFFIIKYLITAIAVLVVLMHKNFTIFKYFLGYHGLYIMLLSYVLLITYELAMLSIMNTSVMNSSFINSSAILSFF